MVQSEGSALRMVECGTIKIPADRSHSFCLSQIAETLRAWIERARPDVAAIEGIFYCKNVRTAVILGQARGVVIATCAALGLPVYEYEPRRMKQALVGYGGAQKSQVAHMVTRLLALKEVPQEDAADALGLAICHIQSRSSIAALDAEPI